MADDFLDALQVVPQIYESMLDLDGLPHLAETLVRLGGGHAGGLIARSSAEKVHVFAQMGYNLDPTSQKSWVEHFANISPLLPLELCALPGDVTPASQIVASDSYKRSVFYNDWARKRDHFDFIGIILAKEARAIDYFAILRPHRAGLVTPFELEQIKIVAPHVRRAYLVGNLLNECKAKVDALGNAIANAGFGVVLAGHDGQLIYVNDAAETLIRLGRGLICRQNRIGAADGQADQQLKALILDAALPFGDKLPGGSMILSDEDGERSLVVHVVPVSRQASSHLVKQDRLMAGLFIVNRGAGAPERVNAFASLYGLTAAETRVFSELISGEGLTKAAERLKITEPTARTHLRNILAKTQTHRQAELMRLFFEVTIPFERSAPDRAALGRDLSTSLGPASPSDGH